MGLNLSGINYIGLRVTYFCFYFFYFGRSILANLTTKRPEVAVELEVASRPVIKI